MPQRKTARGHKKSFGDGGSICYLDCGAGIKHNFLDPNKKMCTWNMCISLLLSYNCQKTKLGPWFL